MSALWRYWRSRLLRPTLFGGSRRIASLLRLFRGLTPPLLEQRRHFGFDGGRGDHGGRRGHVGLGGRRWSSERGGRGLVGQGGQAASECGGLARGAFLSRINGRGGCV